MNSYIIGSVKGVWEQLHHWFREVRLRTVTSVKGVWEQLHHWFSEGYLGTVTSLVQ